ncbi:tetratricopeptide repeat protein [Shewanella sp. A25]|nr:tetratricopeptide repeat protein [Shewanella shenzhenensis]
MSVINKMLQDLDKRQHEHAVANIAPQQAQYFGRTTSSRKWLPMSLVSLLLGGLSVYAFQNANMKRVESASTMAVDALKIVKETEVVIENSQNGDAEITVQTQERVSSNYPQAVPANTVAQQVTPQAESKVAVTASTENNAPESTAKGTQAPVPNANDVKVAQVKSNQPSVIDSVNVELKPAAVPKQDAKLAANTEVNSEANSEPKSEPIKAATQMAVTEVKLSPSQLAQKQVTLAIDAQNSGKAKKAIDHFNKALSLDASLHEARKQLAALYYGEGKLTETQRVLEQGRLLYPQEYEFALLLARTQQESGQTELALASLAQIPDSHELARQKWLAQSDLAQKQGHFSLVEQAYRNLLQQEPRQGKWWMGLAYALDSQQQYAKASQAYRSALSNEGLSAQATAFIEQRLHQLGDSQ